MGQKVKKKKSTVEPESESEEKRRRTLKNCYVKVFLFSDGTSSRYYYDATQHLQNNEEVRVLIYSKRMGDCISSPILKYKFGFGQKFIETKRYTYLIVGKEPAKKIKEAVFFAKGISGGLSTKNTLDLAKVLQFLQLGAIVYAQVFEKKGKKQIVGSLIEYNPAKRYFVTENHSIYHW